MKNMHFEKQNKLLEEKVTKLKAENKDLRDKLARLKSEKADLGRSLKEENDIFHLSPAGIILLQNGRITGINKTMLDHLKSVEVEVLGKDYMDLVHPDNIASEKDILSQWVKGKNIFEEHETSLVNSNGETIYCGIRAKKARIRNRNTLILSLFRIEERKRQEREVFVKGKKDALDRLTSGVIGILTPCLEKCEDILLDNNGIRGNPMQETSLNVIKANIDHARSYIDKLRILNDHGFDRENWTVFDLSVIVSDSIQQIRSEWTNDPERKGENITLRTYLRAKSKIKGNPKEIKTAVLNIMKNAAESMPEGGEIHISTEESGNYSHIYILDSGKGVPDQLRDVIFDPCFTTKGESFPGLGLSISLSIIKKHDGDIEFISRKNQGSIFDIRLPLVNIEIPKKAKTSRIALRNLNILIIENEGIVRELVSHAFKTKGNRVDIAENELEGLAKIKKGKFDLVVADFATLDVMRHSFIKKVKGIEPGLLIVLIKENRDNAEEENSEYLAADLVLKKPIDTVELSEKALKLVAKNLEGKGYGS